MIATVSEETFKHLRDFIYEKSGIFISDSKRYFLENRLRRWIQERNFKGYEDYLYSLKYGHDKNEQTKLFDLVTTNETFFFREPQQLDVVGRELLDRIIADNTKSGCREIKIWSAASSTGEEPYTLAIMLLEKQIAAPCKKEIYASDICESVLNSAKTGVYGSYAVRNIPGAYLTKYFKNVNQQYSLSLEVKSIVRFMRINLVEERDTKIIRGVDVIFCRNVLIYFDDKAKQKAVSLLYDALKPRGYLIVGTSESLHNVTRAFRPVIMNKVIVYQKV